MKLIAHLSLFSLLFLVPACQPAIEESSPPVETKQDTFKSKTAVDRPHIWCWDTYSEEKDYDAMLQKMVAHGMTGLLLNASVEGYKKVVPLAEKHGIELHAWLWILNNHKIADQHPEWLSVNRAGYSLAEKKAYVDYYKFLCPAIPEVREAIYSQVEEILSIEGVHGISCDYTRYVDVILPENLQPNYGIVQDKEYPEWDYGYHPFMIEKFMAEYGYDPRNQVEPAFDINWSTFRYKQVNEIVNELANRAHALGKEISASPFPSPTVARRICKQDWGNWDLDFVFPMVYYGFYGGTDKKWIGDCIREGKTAMAHQEAEIYAGFFVPDHLNDSIPLNTAFNIAIENGASGISVYDFNAITDAQWELIKMLNF
ncbi:MAG: family 10 glycosylhydrolase [Saprospiraceae bacterium]|nr:family 10 glycosylhydrolase [Saprospiraceae bacterium]